MPKLAKRLVALVAAIALLVVGGVVASALLPPRQSDDIAVPADDATPEEVVTAYLEALNAHDCATAEAVSTRDDKDGVEQWCEDVASLADVEVSDHLTERPQWSGHAPPDEVANVSVTFDLDWRLFHDDGSLPEGPTVWGYLLVRPSPDAPWRIFDQGVG